MRSGLVIAIASACASPVKQAAPATEPAAAHVVAPPQAATGPMIAQPASDAPLEAPPGGAIELAAVTPDGGAAITIDVAGGVRLWPALDGSREPLVIAINAPVELAIERAGSGFIVGSIDEGRDLVLTLLDAGGRVLAHRGLAGDPGFAGVAAIDGGLVAWTSDSKLELFGSDGALRGTLATQPGERLHAVATARTHAVADLEVAGSAAPRRRVRAVTLGPALAWGGFVDGDHAPSGPIALAPSGNRLAMVEGQQLVVVDIAHGTTMMSEPAAAKSLAFADDRRLAAITGPIAWFTEQGLVPKFGPASPEAAAGEPAIVGTGAANAVALIGGVLALATPQQVQYLGYAIATATAAAAGGSGSLMIAGGGRTTLLDGALRAHGEVHAGVPTSLAWLGGDDWLAVGNGAPRLVSARGGEPAIAGSDATATLASFEPSTSIATASFATAAATVYRWDAARRALHAIARSPRTAPYLAVQLVPTAPARAHGTHLVRVQWRDHATVDWFSDELLAARTATAEVASVLAVDSAARVYALTLGAKPHVAILAGGVEVGRLPLAVAAAVYPDATGEHVAALTPTALDVYKGARKLWTHAAAAARSVQWLSDGSLALVSTDAIERLDAATGQTLALRCGWSFGLWPTPLAPPPQIESPCAR